ncbi:MAG: hypothetical protein ACKVZJ_12225 [Phycisphaerales bacterium]
MRMMNRMSLMGLVVGVSALCVCAGTARAVEPTVKFWASLEGGAFDAGPWVRFNGEGYDPTEAPDANEVAVFDVDFVFPPRGAGTALGQFSYQLTIPSEVWVFGMGVGDNVLIPASSNPKPINLGAGGLRIGLAPDRGGLLAFPGIIRSAGPVVIGGAASSAAGRPTMEMASTSRLIAAEGVDVIPNGLLDGAGVIEGAVRNGGRVKVFDGSSASLSVRGGYTQERPGVSTPFGGVLEVEIAGPSENNDLLAVQGHAELGGTLLVNLLGGYSPVPGQLDASILTATSLSGRFDLVFFSPAIESNLRLRVNYPTGAGPALRGDERSFQSVRVTVEELPPQPNIGDGGDGAAPIPGRPARATAADLNGDGFIDVAAVIPLSTSANSGGGGGGGTTGGQVLVILNLGVNAGGGWRGFADPVVIAPGGGFNPADIAAGDLDGDDDNDLAVVVKGVPIGTGGTDGPGFLRVFLNDGAGVFALFPTAYPVGNDPRGVALANFVSDVSDSPDAVVTSLDNAGDGQVVVLVNSGALRAWGGFGNTFAQPLDNTDPGTVQPGGLDNPKDTDDIAVSSGSSGGASGGGTGAGSINILINNNALALRGEGGGPLPGFQPPIRVEVGAGPRNLAVRDVDGDGDADIVTSNFDDGTVSIVLNDLGDARGAVGAGSFRVQSLPIGDQPGVVAAFDFDADTDTDLAAVVDAPITRGSGTVIQVLRNDTTIPSPGDRGGAGPSGLVFSRGATIDFDTNPLYLIPGDVDNDGDIDVIAFVEPDGAPSRLAVAFVNALCPTDLDGSGVTDTEDLCRFLYRFGSEVEPGGIGDFNRDGAVDSRDLVRFLGRFGRSCE